VVICVERGANYLHIEGSVHKASISVYFQFSVFTPSDRSWQACEASNFATQEKL